MEERLQADVCAPAEGQQFYPGRECVAPQPAAPPLPRGCPRPFPAPFVTLSRVVQGTHITAAARSIRSTCQATAVSPHMHPHSQDDTAVAAVETVLTCLCVADPGPEPAPGGSSGGLGVGVGGLGTLPCGVGVGLGPWPRQPEERQPLCFVSPGFMAMTGYSEQECLGRNCRFLQQPPPGAVAQVGAAVLSVGRR